MEMMHILWVTPLKRSHASSLSNPSVLVAISKWMWAVKLYFNRILQFLTVVAS